MSKISSTTVHSVKRLVFVLLAFLSCMFNFAKAQNATLFKDSFDPASSSWTLGSVAGENQWNIGACSGNGTSIPGDSAAYVTTGASILCGLDYAYTNSASTSSIILSHTIDATCASGGLFLVFDYQIQGDASDFLEVVYSTNGGSTWNVVSTMAVQATWGAASPIALPGVLAGTSFELGFRFNYDNTTINGVPAAIDNIIVSGADNVPPVLNCPSSDTIPSDPIICSAGLGKMNSSLISLSDNCTDSASINFVQTPDQSYILSGNLSSVLVNIVVTDEAGNQNTCDINVVLLDVTPPNPVCPADTTQYLDNNCQALLADFNGYVLSNSTDNCGLGTTTQSPTPGTSFSGDNTTQLVTMTVNDAAGNQATCTFNVTFQDTVPPALTCPDSLPVYLNASCTGVVPDYRNYIATNFAHDSCSAPGTITATQNLVAGSFMPSNQTITYTVTDNYGNSATCPVMLVLKDNTPPSIVCAASSYFLYPSVGCSAPLPNYATSDPPVTSDNCPGTLTITQNPPAGTIVSGINNHVFLIATDVAGNKDSCEFIVNVKDTVKPIIVCPNDTVFPSNNFCQGTLLNFNYLSQKSDNCADTFNLSQNLTQTPVAGTTITGNSPVTVTLTTNDNSGNYGSCTFQVTFVDITPPALDTIMPITVYTSSSVCNDTLADYASTAVAHDNCTGDPSITYTQLPPAGAIITGIGLHTFKVIAHDQAGNTDTMNVNLTILDTITPSVSGCPASQTVYASTTCTGTLGDYTTLISPSDNCTSGGSLIINQTPVAGSSINANTSVSISVSDASGNTNNTCSFTVIFQDSLDPQLTCISDSSVVADASCDYTIPNLVAVTPVSDNCDASPSLVQSPLAGASESGLSSVTLTATDASGNISTCIINLIPISTPVSITSCAPNHTINTTLCDSAIADYRGQVSYTAPCGGVTLTQVPASGTVLPTGNHNIQIIAQDVNGNTDTCSFNLLIKEASAPVITCPSDTTTCSPLVSYVAPVGTDNCAVTTVQTDGTGLSSGSIFPVGTTQLQYTAMDSSGNNSSCTFNITVLMYPDTATVMNDFDICDTTSTVISADPAMTGTGVWSVINGGTASINNNFANLTGVNNLQFGANTFVWTIQSPSCGSTADTLTITLYELPNPPASTLDVMYACSETSIEITGNSPTVGYGYWHDANGMATFADSSAVPTQVSNLQNGWNYIIWSIGNGNCPVSSDTIDIYVNQQAVIYTSADSIGKVCLNNNVIEVSGVPPTIGASCVWYVAPGDGDVQSPNSPQTEITNLDVGLNYVVYKISHPECDATSDTLLVDVEDCNEFGSDFPTMITPNGDGNNDLWVLDNLNILYPDCNVTIFDQWGNSVFTSTGYAKPWDGTFKGKPVPMGTYFYVIQTNGTDKKVLKGNVSVIH